MANFFEPEFNVGDVVPLDIGPHEVLDILGSGGMGYVLRVRHADPKRGKREKALKIPHKHLIDRPEVIERFEAEGQVISEFDHDNIIKIDSVYTLLTTPPRPVIMMELLHGYPLSFVMQESEELLVTDACTIAIGVLNALEVIHRQNMVHRDIKPENIFVQKRTKGPTRVVLIDFGIMKQIIEEGQTKGRKETVRTFLGTYSNASPEQLRGEKITTKSDFYSLGTILYEILARQPMFPDKTEPRDIGQAHVEQLPRPLHELAPSAPPELCDIIMMSLAKSPEARPKDVHAFRTPFANVRNRTVRNEAATAGNSTIERLLNPTVAGDRVFETPAPKTGTARLPVVTTATTIPQATFRGTEPDVSRDTDPGRLASTPIQASHFHATDPGLVATDQTATRSRPGNDPVILPVHQLRLPLIVLAGAIVVAGVTGTATLLLRPSTEPSRPASVQAPVPRVEPRPLPAPDPTPSALTAVASSTLAAPSAVASTPVAAEPPTPVPPSPPPHATHRAAPRPSNNAAISTDVSLFEDIKPDVGTTKSTKPAAQGNAAPKSRLPGAGF